MRDIVRIGWFTAIAIGIQFNNSIPVHAANTPSQDQPEVITQQSQPNSRQSLLAPTESSMEQLIAFLLVPLLFIVLFIAYSKLSDRIPSTHYPSIGVRGGRAEFEDDEAEKDKDKISKFKQ